MLSRRRAIVALFSAFVMVAWLAPDLSAQTKTIDGTWKWTQAGFGGGRRAGGGAGGPGGGGGGNRGPASQPAGGAPASQPGAGAGAPGGGGRAGGGRGGQPREYSLTLKQDGEKVTGKITGANFQDPTAAEDIKAGAIKDGEVTFKVERDFNGNVITTTYKGKLDGDTITGTSLLSFGEGGGFGGQAPAPAEWIAKRDVPAAK